MDPVFDFVTKAYSMVDDPTTDSLVSWGPDGSTFVVWDTQEFSRVLLTRVLGITNFADFEQYGFSQIVSGPQQLEFTCDDFVRGKPDLLVKIAERYHARVKAIYDAKFKSFVDRLKNCKSREEMDLVTKEQREKFEMEMRERIETRKEQREKKERERRERIEKWERRRKRIPSEEEGLEARMQDLGI